MSDREPHDVRFDVEAAIGAIHRAAVEAGAVSASDGRAEDPKSVSLAHSHGARESSCRKSPCRVGGLCYALRELLQYREGISQGGEFIAAADKTEDMCIATDAYVGQLRSLLNQGLDAHDSEADDSPDFVSHDHDMLCVLPYRLIELITEMRPLLDSLTLKLRGHFYSFELQQSNHRKRSDLLLTAVLQHLDWGGLKAEEIYALVPDGDGQLGFRERLDYRLGLKNARSIIPYVPSAK